MDARVQLTNNSGERDSAALSARRSWPLSRRSGRFPPEPYPPLRPYSILRTEHLTNIQEHNGLTVASARAVEEELSTHPCARSSATTSRTSVERESSDENSPCGNQPADIRLIKPSPKSRYATPARFQSCKNRRSLLHPQRNFFSRLDWSIHIRVCRGGRDRHANRKHASPPAATHQPWTRCQRLVRPADRATILGAGGPRGDRRDTPDRTRISMALQRTKTLCFAEIALVEQRFPPV